ncbi:hypothetical protein E0H35_30610 [Rhizobium leguminosarum bv. viciae]|uniref:hypothetical protein n=1 Tax=Rhizobium leguminosarum TaxID=384 RepID=UPI00103A46F5|nr:hypothetical protein [Rhizobium leguminosarum]MBY5340446.1 hypothetical protein [Rhizobium leguminosarum]NKK49347.1 hypothetical protein [Rhizobium leguminosarum bv. viciae]TBY90886.1 hypothetical protein E0H35_30610 [Rhizobium leguminosarum bv. viciae]
MSTITSTLPNGEVLRSAASAATMFSHRSFGPGARIGIGEPAALRRHPHIVRFAEVEGDLDVLIDRAITAIADGEPIEDEILGHYVHIASLVRAVSFREGKLLEQAVERLAKANPNITLLTQSLKLPLVKAALEAVSGNDWSCLDGIKLDCEAPAKGSYTPDLIVVNRARHTAYILDLKRSLASYGDTSRLEELKLKMMASAMVLPDWLYKHHKRMMVDTVEVAIVDGASRPSDHATGIWALSEIDDLLEIDGVAACMAELRLRFGRRVQQLLEAEARKALGVPETVASDEHASTIPGKPRIALNGSSRSYEKEQAMAAPDEDDGHYDLGCFDEDQDDEPEPVHIRVGFARRPRRH